MTMTCITAGLLAAITLLLSAFVVTLIERHEEWMRRKAERYERHLSNLSNPQQQSPEQIEIQIAGGTTLRFPFGTPSHVIEAALASIPNQILMIGGNSNSQRQEPAFECGVTPEMLAPQQAKAIEQRSTSAKLLPLAQTLKLLPQKVKK